jgi:hypothetical protein
MATRTEVIHSWVTMLVCGDNKSESRAADGQIYRDIMGGKGVLMGTDHPETCCKSGVMDLEHVSADLTANLLLYHVDDVRKPPKLLFSSELTVLVYAGKAAKGFGNLPELQKSLKNREHRIDLPEMLMLRLDEVLATPSDTEHEVGGSALKFARACGKKWPRAQTVECDMYELE